jgi:hypothetical protein
MPRASAGPLRSKDVLDAEQRRVLDEFSLDNKGGALTRVVTQLEATNGKFQGNIEKQINAAVRELSLDEENSALSAGAWCQP